MTARRLGRRTSAVALAAAAVALTALDGYGQPVASETVVDIRVHGNHTTSDDDILAVAGVAVGDVVDPDVVDTVTRRLEASGRFETVEVRKRYRSLTATDRIALVIVVRERPRASVASPVLRALARIPRQSMFLPIVRYDEGYGMSYGARFSLVDLLGDGSRLSAPITWGGDRRAGLEAERPIAGVVVDRVRAGASYGAPRPSLLRRRRPADAILGRRGSSARAGPAHRGGGGTGGGAVSRASGSSHATDRRPGVRRPLAWRLPPRRRASECRAGAVGGCRPAGGYRPTPDRCAGVQGGRRTGRARGACPLRGPPLPRCRPTSKHCSAAAATSAGGASAHALATGSWRRRSSSGYR